MSNILITSARRNTDLAGLLKLTILNFRIGTKVYICGIEADKTPTCTVIDGNFTLPQLTSEDCMQVLQSICLGNEVKVIIPTTERELPILSANKDIFAKLGIYILTPDYYSVMKCVDNHNFSGYLNNIGININMLGNTDKYETLVDMYFTNVAFAEFIVRKYLLNERIDHFDA